MKILVISDNYPSPTHPTNGVFVFNLIQQFAKLGHEVTVIAPYQVVPRKMKLKKYDYGQELAKVYRPLFTSFSTKQIGKYNTYDIARMIQVNAIKRIVKKNKIEFDVVYCHFIKNALLAVEALEKYNKPFVAAVGENRNIELVQKWYNKQTYHKFFKKIDAFVAVSEVIREKLISMNTAADRIIVEPNGVDFEIYYKRENKKELREKYNLPADTVLAVFIGHFIQNKGPLRLVKAAAVIKDLGLIFIGEGKQDPVSEQIVFKQKVPRHLVPELLSAADLFVLPTQHEGSSNAIVEAMACGLPIVSADIPEIRVQCEPSFSILVDPNNVEEISNAMQKIVSDRTLQQEMGKNAETHSKKFSVTARAQRIINFINTISNKS
jgi:teichuronic acid biosynthesis glycosyltransferase TuaC